MDIKKAIEHYNDLLEIGENDHAMDDIRYFCNTVMKNKIGKSEYIQVFM